MPRKRTLPDIRLLDRQTKILKSLADQHSRRSKEFKAIRYAALALTFAMLEHPEEFKAFDGPPTAAQRRQLREMGLA